MSNFYLNPKYDLFGNFFSFLDPFLQTYARDSLLKLLQHKSNYKKCYNDKFLVRTKR